MEKLSEGKSYPFESLPLANRYDLVKASTEVYYCLFSKETEKGLKYGLFKNNLTGDGLESRRTESYSVVGEEFGYDEVKVCPTGISTYVTQAIFLVLIKHSPDLCQVLSISIEDGCNILFSGATFEDCRNNLKEYLGVNISFGNPDYFQQRIDECQYLIGVPSSDALYLHFKGKYEFQGSPYVRSFYGESFYLGIVKKSSGKYNYLNFNTEKELSPIDFDRYTEMSRKGTYSFKVGNRWLTADIKGVLPDYKKPKDWFSYDCLPSLLEGKDINQFKQNEYEDIRKGYSYYDPNMCNPDSLIETMREHLIKLTDMGLV